MIYALIGFMGVVIGAACVFFGLTLTEEECDSALAPYTESAEERRLQKQWQNLLNFTADAGGEQDDTER